MAALVAMMFALVLAPKAHADASSTPMATNYLARVHHAPAGIEAKVVDAYLQLYMSVPANDTVEVIDQLGAPYIRFDREGVYVNHNSIEYFVSQVPVPALPPRNLTAQSPARWVKVSSAHHFTWRDGRLHAFTQEAIAPDTTYVGPWRIPLIVNGSRTAVEGGIWHASPPSGIWFWPIAVILLCVLAAWRIRSATLDTRLTKALAAVLLITLGVAAVGHELHGRPDVGDWQYLLLFLELGTLAVAAARFALGRSKHLLNLGTALIALWIGLMLAPSLLHHYVMMALPYPASRVLTVVLLGGGLSLFLQSVRVLGTAMAADRAARRRAVPA